MRQSSAQQVRYSIDTVLALRERGGRSPRILPVSTGATYGRWPGLPERRVDAQRAGGSMMRGQGRVFRRNYRDKRTGAVKVAATFTLERSEERRVGKECRSRWS